jgi:hypothetical protein
VELAQKTMQNRYDVQIVKLQGDLGILSQRYEEKLRELQRAEIVAGKMEEKVARLEKQLEDERTSAQRFQHAVDGQKTNLVADLQSQMARSHTAAMRALETSQATNGQVTSAMANALVGQSIQQMRNKGARLLQLMPPSAARMDLRHSGAKSLYHKEASAFLNEQVTDMARGEALLREIETAASDAQALLDQERKRAQSATLAPAEVVELQNTIDEEQARVAALFFQRDMLANGLKRTPQPAQSQSTSHPTATHNGIHQTPPPHNALHQAPPSHNALHQSPPPLNGLHQAPSSHNGLHQAPPSAAPVAVHCSAVQPTAHPAQYQIPSSAAEHSGPPNSVPARPGQMQAGASPSNPVGPPLHASAFQTVVPPTPATLLPVGASHPSVVLSAVPAPSVALSAPAVGPATAAAGKAFAQMAAPGGLAAAPAKPK